MRNQNKAKADEMRSHIEARAKSNLTVEQYCKDNGLLRSSYYYWHKKLTVQNKPGSFVPLTFHGQPQGEIRITYPNGVHIIFSGSFSVSDIKQLACYI
jgi:hypothetical protein